MATLSNQHTRVLCIAAWCPVQCLVHLAAASLDLQHAMDAETKAAGKDQAVIEVNSRCCLAMSTKYGLHMLTHMPWAQPAISTTK